MQRKEPPSKRNSQRNSKILKLLATCAPIDLDLIKKLIPLTKPLTNSLFLGLAVTFGHNEVVGYLLTPDCNLLSLHSADELGRALFYLVQNNQPLLAKKLIYQYPQVNKSWFIYGLTVTPLGLALQQKVPDLELVSLLNDDMSFASNLKKRPLITRNKICALLQNTPKQADRTAANMIMLLKYYLADHKKRNSLSQLFHPLANIAKKQVVDKLLKILIQNTSVEMESNELKFLIKSDKFDNSILKIIFNAFFDIKELAGLRSAITECYTLRPANTYVEMTIDQDTCNVLYENLNLSLNV